MGIKFHGHDERQSLEPGSLVLRFSIPGETNEEDLVVEDISNDENNDDVADAACAWLEENAPRAKGYIFRVDTDDQSTKLYDCNERSWRRVGV